ncbi:hypothetical protein H6G80_21960 [Nostoc sp. FACHB-87]|uniref:hypothetical protein n=1 Tax=Nostocales TaxID=1161 RepID=UPI0016828BEC|nr:MULTISPECIES: hypothetical protein [Nostocales]MBD2301752.1 hypothetical protein [Nostoc sp. FACHB-190]MBD2456732.1 hypothetical protein [Nostoc sp. FACHB-87]MBD2478013.1 hypothetical protein [Anabaena sp. FACHB-83]MBD2490899.1 hypothetical protein [Aulosira sp. FACHB-615]
MQKHRLGKVVVFFGNFPLTIHVPAAPRNEQLNFLRDRIIFHANNLVEHGLWEEPLSDRELERIMADVEIEPVFFPRLCDVVAYPGQILRKLFRH